MVVNLQCFFYVFIRVSRDWDFLLYGKCCAKWHRKWKIILHNIRRHHLYLPIFEVEFFVPIVKDSKPSTIVSRNTSVDVTGFLNLPVMFAIVLSLHGHRILLDNTKILFCTCGFTWPLFLAETFLFVILSQVVSCPTITCSESTIEATQ